MMIHPFSHNKSLGYKLMLALFTYTIDNMRCVMRFLNVAPVKFAMIIDWVAYNKAMDAVMTAGSNDSFNALYKGITECGQKAGWFDCPDVPFKMGSKVPLGGIPKGNTFGLVPLEWRRCDGTSMEHFIAFCVNKGNKKIIWFDPALPRLRKTRQNCSYYTLVDKLVRSLSGSRQTEWATTRDGLPVQPSPESSNDPFCAFYSACALGYLIQGKPIPESRTIRKKAHFIGNRELGMRILPKIWQY